MHTLACGLSIILLNQRLDIPSMQLDCAYMELGLRSELFPWFTSSPQSSPLLVMAILNPGSVAKHLQVKVVANSVIRRRQRAIMFSYLAR